MLVHAIMPASRANAQACGALSRPGLQSELCRLLQPLEPTFFHGPELCNWVNPRRGASLSAPVLT